MSLKKSITGLTFIAIAACVQREVHRRPVVVAARRSRRTSVVALPSAAILGGFVLLVYEAAHHDPTMLWISVGALALAGEPAWSASSIELDRGGRSWTIDTVRALPKAIGEREDCALHLVLGSDNLPALPQWKESRALLERVQPIVIFRDGDPAAQLEPVRAALGDALARKVEAGYLRLPPVRVSSTAIRAALARGEHDVAGVPPSVLAYIREHGLYGARA